MKLHRENLAPFRRPLAEQLDALSAMMLLKLLVEAETKKRTKSPLARLNSDLMRGNQETTEFVAVTSPTEEKLMRVFIVATVLLASSSLHPSFAQGGGQAPTEAPQTAAPAQTDQESSQRPDQRIDRDQPKADDRQMGHDSRMHRGDGDRMGRDDRETGPDWRMHRDREMGGGRDMDRGRYGERGAETGTTNRDRDNRVTSMKPDPGTL